ncbi:MAG: penicillin-binding protein activator LpoB [Bdellovibrionales bacterium]|nr:penicillin-binding protein activator LpoB [Bdellovibrionales bacterium]
MRHAFDRKLFVVVLGSLLGLTACGGPKAFTQGAYDDPTRVELLDDKFNEADMQQMSDTIVKSIVACPEIGADKRPVVMVDQVKNNTEEHIDMSSLTDKIRTALIKSRRVKFIDADAREKLDEEYRYNEAGNVAKDKQKKRGKQTGADYVMRGSMATNIQQVGNDKFIYYKLTMNLVNTESSEIDCTEEKEVRKQYRKRKVGL